MYKSICILYFLLINCLLPAQSDFRFADSTAQWKVCYTSLMEGEQGISSYDQMEMHQTANDTFFNNHSYQKITPGIIFLGSVDEYALIRKDSLGKVYRFDNYTQADRLIYDFSLNAGDTLSVLPSLTSWSSDTVLLLVDSTDTVIIGKARKRMYLRCLSGGPCPFFVSSDVIIEGIGSLKSCLFGPYIYEYATIPGLKFKLIQFEENGSATSFASGCTVGVEEVNLPQVSVYPNPTKGELNITNVTQPDVLQLYDYQGREVWRTVVNPGVNQWQLNALTEGIYFYRLQTAQQSGKLMVVK
jgi:hypothetical protein